jgi:hypothetical protein
MLNEELNRIKGIMGLPINENKKRFGCNRFDNDPEKKDLCLMISDLKSWLHKDEDLGMKSIINKKLESLKSETPDNLKNQYINGVEILKNIGKITENQKKWFIDKVLGQNNLVYVDGEWSFVNKLNTNYFDLADLLTDLLYMGGEPAKNFIDNIKQNPKEGLLSIKKYLPKLIDKYFDDPKKLVDYTQNIKITSHFGEVAEHEVKNKLINLGFTVDYEGGNGDLIDMVYGTDLIMTNPNYGTKTIQVKANENSWNRNDEYKYVDWVIIAEPFTIYNNKTKKIIELL